MLFRDIGPVAMSTFLQGRLQRLAGPLSPIIYMRGAGYREPYVDYEAIGRLVFLQPRRLNPWHSGVDPIYIACARSCAVDDSVAFVPGHCDLAGLARQEAGDLNELRECLGGRDYDQQRLATLERLEIMARELARVEQRAEPLRRLLQCGRSEEKLRVRQQLESWGLSESDLCAAWHHLPPERRRRLAESL